MSRLKKYTLMSLAALVVLGAALALGAVYTSQSSFCVTCHYMEPFYASWKNSEHNKIECIQCHFEPSLKSKIRGKMEGLVQLVKYVSQSYRKSKPWAEISDASCLRSGCHQTRLLHGEVEFKEGIVFNHKPHLTEMRRGKKLRCTSCHSHIVQGTHMKVTESTCFICHFKKETIEAGVRQAAMTERSEKKPERNLAECVLCHKKITMLQRSRQGLMKYDHSLVVESGYACDGCHSHTTIGNAPVGRQNCFACHWETERLEKYDDTELMHRIHITEKKVECLNCHIAIEHKVVHGSVDNVARCGSCHPKHHNAQIGLFLGVGGKDAEGEPSKMFDIGLNCRGCHIFHQMKPKQNGDEEAYFARPESCDKCHGQGFGKILDHWKQVSKEDIERLDEMSAKVESEVARLAKEKETIKLADLLIKESRENVDMVRNGRSVHNIKYSQNLLNVSYEKLKKTLSLIGSDIALPPFERETPESFGECHICHKNIKERAPSLYGLTFSHKNHLEDKRRVEVIEEEDEEIADLDEDLDAPEEEEEEIKGKRLTCQKCHSIMRKHGELVIARDECAACHHKTEVEKKCEDCHTLQKEMIYGSWKYIARPSKMSPIAKKAGLAKKWTDCTDCHDRIKKGVRHRDKVCEDCHKEEDVKKLPVWRKSTKQMMDEFARRLEVVKFQVPEAYEGDMKDVEDFLDGLKNDGSMGVHNYPAIEEAADKMRKKLDRLEKAASATANVAGS